MLDGLLRSGRTALLVERDALGAGQTVCAQGIIHGGLKYTLDGVLHRSASCIAEMPGIWRECLLGRRQPHLTATHIRAEHCYLWRTDSIASRLGMMGARVGLRVRPKRINPAQLPPILANVPGTVAQLAEQVIDPVSLLADLAQQHESHIIRCASDSANSSAGASMIHDVEHVDHGVRSFILRDAETHQSCAIMPGNIILTAGAGNRELMTTLGMQVIETQLRPLHMTMLRGELPEINGHCVHGNRTRVTITSARDAQNRIVWQLGGQLAEDGVAMDTIALVKHARNEITTVLPDIALDGTEWATYRIDRAEPATKGRRRPDDAVVVREGNIIAAWPTKLALVPRLAKMIRARMDDSSPSTISDTANVASAFETWQRPQIAKPPWEWATTFK